MHFHTQPAFSKDCAMPQYIAFIWCGVHADFNIFIFFEPTIDVGCVPRSGTCPWSFVNKLDLKGMVNKSSVSRTHITVIQSSSNMSLTRPSDSSRVTGIIMAFWHHFQQPPAGLLLFIIWGKLIVSHTRSITWTDLRHMLN